MEYQPYNHKGEQRKTSCLSVGSPEGAGPPRAVSISSKCLFYRKEVWVKLMQENE